MCGAWLDSRGDQGVPGWYVRAVKNGSLLPAIVLIVAALVAFSGWPDHAWMTALGVTLSLIALPWFLSAILSGRPERD